jgi:hypothetical protein
VGFRKDKGGKDDWFIAALRDYRSGTVVATTGGLWGASGREGQREGRSTASYNDNLFLGFS